MNYRFISLLFTLLLTGVLYAVPSSSRNLKSFSDIELEEKTKSAQNIELSDGSTQPTVERVTFLGPKTGWGFVAKECAQYSLQGKNIGSCSAGTLFKYNDVLSSSKNDMLLAVIRTKEGWDEPCLLPCDCVASYDGDPETVDIEIVASLRKYFLLSGKVESRKEAILQTEHQKNPFYQLYQEAGRDYNDSVEIAQKMQLEAEPLTGARKTRAYEKLREFKYKQEKLHMRLNDVAQQYREWKKNNPFDLSKINDTELHELKKEMESVKSKVAHLIPHEES